MKLSKVLSTLLLICVLAGCSNGGNSPGTSAVPDQEPVYSVDPSTIDVGNADYCDFLQSRKCLYPFPNNYFTVEDTSSNTGLRWNIDTRAFPINAAGEQPDTTEFNRNDGFSPGPLILAYVAGLDLVQTGAAPITDISKSLQPDAPIQLLHADSGERQLIWAELDAHPEDDNNRSLMLRVAKNLIEGERYIVVLQNLKDANGQTINADDAFRIYLENIPSDIPAIESRREAIDNILSTVERHGIVRDDLYLSWDFTVASTENITGRVIHMRDQALTALAEDSPAVSIEEIIEFSEEENPNISRIVHGMLAVPNFLNRADAGPGSVLNYENTDTDALPAINREAPTVEAPFLCVIPHVALQPESDTRAVIVGHGLLGSRDIAVSLAPMAQEQDLMLCAMDWWGFSDADLSVVAQLLANLSKFPTMPDRLQQSFVNKTLLSEAILHSAGLAALPAFQREDGSAAYVPGEVHFDGLSQGAILGGALSAVNPNFNRSVLNVAGMNFGFLIRRSNAWDFYRLPFDASYPDDLDRALLMSLIQGLFDRAENNGYVNHISRDPLPGSLTSQVLIHAAVGDQTVNETTAEILARSMGTKRHSPTVVEGRHIALEPYFGIEPIDTYPLDGNALIIWDSGPFPIAGHPGTPLQNLTNLPTRGGYNTHGMPFGQRLARDQKATFWRTGQVVNVCGELPCFGDGYDGTPGEFSE
jgi:hypothetical protein